MTGIVGPYGLIYETSMVEFLHLCLHAVIFIFYYSDRRSLKIKKKTLTTDNSETYPGWLELALTGTNFHDPKPVRVTEFLLYFGYIFFQSRVVITRQNVI